VSRPQGSQLLDSLCELRSMVWYSSGSWRVVMCGHSKREVLASYESGVQKVACRAEAFDVGCGAYVGDADV
jgi:hypothetical protein